MIYILVAAMVASGGMLGAFWVRALTIMRRQVIDSTEGLHRLADAVRELEGQLNALGKDHLEIQERLETAERLLARGPIEPDGRTTN
jgi:hypothetical protein